MFYLNSLILKNLDRLGIQVCICAGRYFLCGFCSGSDDKTATCNCVPDR